MPSLFLLVNIREPQPINAKLVLPIIPIGIVAYAFTLVGQPLSKQLYIFHLFPLTYKRVEWISSALLTLSPCFQLHVNSDADAITTLSEVEISEIELRTTALENLKGDRSK